MVLIPFDEYNAMKETQYLMTSQAKRKRLLDSLKELREKRGIKKVLVE